MRTGADHGGFTPKALCTTPNRPPHKARIEVLQSELPALRAFSADPRNSPAHMEGLAGFDAQIATSLRVVEEQDHIDVAGLPALGTHAGP